MPQSAKFLVNRPQLDSGTATPREHWKKELADAETSAFHLLKRLKLESHMTYADEHSRFRCLAPESYIKKMQIGNINDPLLRQVLPVLEESCQHTQQTGVSDPVGDLNAMASPGLLHKYHGRALLISTGACAIHCRYCFRRHYPYQQSSCSGKDLDRACDYLRRHPEIDEVILSGGDPLVLDNEKLSPLITKLESLAQLSILRIHTRLPIVIPARINRGLLQLLQASRFDVVMVIHANHASELQHAEYEKLHALHEAGITLLNQSVLLKGINDTVETLAALSRRLLQCRTLPYYLHQLDPVTGAMHLGVDREHALELNKQMLQTLPGYLVPKLVQEIAGKQSKTAIFRI